MNYVNTFSFPFSAEKEFDGETQKHKSKNVPFTESDSFAAYIITCCTV